MNDLNDYQKLDEKYISKQPCLLAVEKKTNIIVQIDTYRRFLNEPFIFNLKGIVRILAIKSNPEDEDITVITEFLQNGKVNNLVKNYLTSNGSQNKKINPTIRSKIIFGVASIMKRLHEHNIVHRNFNNNIYLDNFLEPKIKLTSDSSHIGDQIIFDEMEDSYGLFISSPEAINSGSIDAGFSNDVFVYAFFLYSMFSNKLIFTNDEGNLREAKSLFQFQKRIADGQRFNRPENILDSYWELIQQCWNQDPDSRPTFEEITERLRGDQFVLEEFGMTTDINALHDYQRRIEEENQEEELNADTLKAKIDHLESILPPKSTIRQGNVQLNFIGTDDEEQFHQNMGAIGEGQTSITYKIKDTRTGNFLCKKVLKFRAGQTNIRDARNAMQEFEILSVINHPCICKSVGINTSEPLQVVIEGENREITTIAVFLEYIPHSLSSLLQQGNLIDNTMKVKIAVEVAHAMKFIHMNGMIHRDLKIENIMLNSVFEVKLVDFGLVKIFESVIDQYSFVQDSLTRGVGTIAYMSPEMMNEEEYDNKTDVYSFGVVLFVLFVGSLPRQHLRDVMSGQPIRMPDPSPSISQFCITLISQCLSPSAADRPSFEAILSQMRENSFNLASNVDDQIIKRRDMELQYIENE